MTGWLKARLGRMRVSTIVLIAVFVALFWVNQTVEPTPPPPPAPTQAVVPPGFVPDPNYTWVPRTNVRRPKEPAYTTTTTTPTTTTTTTTTPTTTEPDPTTTVIDPDGAGPRPPTTQTIAPGSEPVTTEPAPFPGLPQLFPPDSPTTAPPS